MVMRLSDILLPIIIVLFMFASVVSYTWRAGTFSEKNIIHMQEVAKQHTLDITTDFVLTDHNSNVFKFNDIKDKYKLIMFGFSRCPDVCPTELQTVTNALNDMALDDVKMIIPMFITLDPKHDTVKVLKNFHKNFHPNIFMLTGTSSEIEKVKNDFSAFSTETVDEDKNFLIDHSSIIYLFDKENRYIDFFTQHTTGSEMSKKLEQFISTLDK